MIIGRQLVNSYYEDEKLYSTGNDDLDDLLEKAFCEGYEFAQREFGNKQNKKAQRAWKIREALKDPEIAKSILTEERPEIHKSVEYEKKVPGGVMSVKKKENRTYYDNEFALRKYREKKSKENNDSLVPRGVDPNAVVHVGRGENGGWSRTTYNKPVDDQLLSKSKERLGDSYDVYKDIAYQKYKDTDNPEVVKKIKRLKELKDKKAKAQKREDIKNKVINGVKNNKGAIIAGTLGTAALVGGGIALHRYNKKKKEQQEKEDKED